MTLRMFDFECSNGHFFEKLVDAELRETNCSLCGALALRLISPVRCKLDPFSGDFTTASDAWAQRREDHMRKERKVAERHGSAWEMYPARHKTKKDPTVQ